jgi:hypothetical protein
MRQKREVNLIRATLSVALLASYCASGCAQKPVEVWEPKPRTEWQHVMTVTGDAPVNDFSVNAAHQTTGLFPANVAVTRVAVEDNDEGGLEPRLNADPRNEFLQWNSTFDNLMAVSEVFPIDQRDLGGGDATPEQILAAFRGLHARLGLVYAVNEISETESEMFGALYETSSLEPVASFHARAVSIELDEDDKDKDDPYNLWKTDSRALVRAKFAEMVHACMRQLIINDQPADVEAPTGWTPSVPVRPVEWPPRQGSGQGR